MTIMFSEQVAGKCGMFRSISATKQNGDTIAITQVKCLRQAVGYDAVTENDTGFTDYVLVCEDHALSLNEPVDE